MHFSTLLTALLSATTALALPASNSTSSTENLPVIEARANYGWLSSYAPNDPHCRGKWGGARPQVKGGCIKFHPISHVVGIHHGSWPLNFGGLDIFMDDDCKVKVHTVQPPSSGDSQCVNTWNTGMMWRSVRRH